MKNLFLILLLLFSFEVKSKETPVTHILFILGSAVQPVDGNKYSIEKAFDGDLNTCWAINKNDKNKSFSIYTHHMDSASFEKIGIFPGYGKTTGNIDDLFHKNYRVKKIKIGDFGGTDTLKYLNEYNVFIFKDEPSMQYFDLDVSNTNRMHLEILNVVKGTAYKDICISEIEFVSKGGIKKLSNYSSVLNNTIAVFDRNELYFKDNNILNGRFIIAGQYDLQIEGSWYLEANKIKIKYITYWPEEDMETGVITKDFNAGPFEDEIYIHGLMNDGRLLIFGAKLKQDKEKAK